METKTLMRLDCAFQDGSYPCGYEDGGKLPDCVLCHKIRKASVKEVEEWVEKRLFDAGDEGYMSMAMDKSEWQAQLKLWFSPRVVKGDKDGN